MDDLHRLESEVERLWDAVRRLGEKWREQETLLVFRRAALWRLRRLEGRVFQESSPAGAPETRSPMELLKEKNAALREQLARDLHADVGEEWRRHRVEGLERALADQHRVTDQQHNELQEYRAAIGLISTLIPDWEVTEGPLVTAREVERRFKNLEADVRCCQEAVAASKGSLADVMKKLRGCVDSKDMSAESVVRSVCSMAKEWSLPWNRAICSIANERQEQRKRWTAAHDDCHTGSEMASAAAYLALRADHLAKLHPMGPMWPWRENPPAKFTNRGRRHELVVAAALLVAEIERLDRAGLGQ